MSVLDRDDAPWERPPAADVGRLALRGVAFGAGKALGIYGVLLAATTVMARYLTAEEYGLIAMATILVEFFGYVSDSGLSWVTIQEPRLERRDVSTLWWINSAMGILFFLLCALSAPVAAWIFGREDVVLPAIALGLTFPFSGTAVQPLALLNRKMQFGRIAAATFGAQFFGSLTGVVLAVQGFGLWALVGQKLVRAMLRSVFYHGAAGYRPGLPGGLRDPRLWQRLRSGGRLMGAGLCGYLTHHVDNALVGFRLGAEALGYYSRAFFLMSLPLQIILRIVSQSTVPALTAVSDDRAAMGALYRRWVSRAVFWGFPMACGMVLVAPEAVGAVYGSRWLPVIPVLAWLSVGSWAHLVAQTYVWLLLATGRNRIVLRWSGFKTFVVTVATVVGLQRGMIGVAAANSLAGVLILFPVGLIVSHRAVRLPVRSTLKVLAAPAFATVFMGSVLHLLSPFVTAHAGTGVLALAAKMAAGALLYLPLATMLQRRTGDLHAIS